MSAGIDGARFGSWPVTDDAIRLTFERMLADGSWGRYHGPHCDALRQALIEYLGTEHVHLCCSGTSAIELALRSAQVGSGDEVILAAYDYKANFANVLAVGARPVLVDTLAKRPVLDPDQLTHALSSTTRAIICSHLHGCLAPIDAILEFAEQKELTLIEDACQVPGARLSDRMAGTIGHIGILSFGGSKLLTAGRGGAVITDDDRIAHRIRLYTQRGNDAYPLSEMQAAVLMPQLHQLNARNAQRRAAVQLLQTHLTEDSPVRVVPDGDADNLSAYYKVAMWMSGTDTEQRDGYAHRLRSEDIPIDPGFQALHRIHATSRFRAVGDLPSATALHNQLLTLHHPCLLADPDDIRQLAAAL